MRAMIAISILLALAFAGCAELGKLSCLGYDLNGDGEVTVQDVQTQYQNVMGTAISEAEAQDYINTYCK